MSGSDDPVVRAGKAYLKAQEEAEKRRQEESRRISLARAMNAQEERKQRDIQRDIQRQVQQAEAQIVAFTRHYVEFLIANQVPPSRYADKKKRLGLWPLAAYEIREEVSHFEPKMPGDDSGNWGYFTYVETSATTVYVASNYDLYLPSTSAKTGWERFERTPSPSYERN